ncbi:MAG: class I SAM-dependent methyltransferase [Acidimicrobiia bacterium]
MDAYERSAHAYDLIQSARGRDDSAQVDRLVAMIDARCPGGGSLLDVACGTGFHLAGLRRHFTDLAGVDLSQAMLRRARALVGDVPLELGDMRTFRLRRQFDVVTCLFSSIGYMVTLDDVRTAVANMAAHVDVGGLLLVEPWIHPDQWHLGHRVAESANADGLAVSRVSVNGREGHVSTFDLYWTIASDEGVEQFTEPHRMGLYTPGQYLDAFRDAGLTVEHDDTGLIGRGMFIGRRLGDDRRPSERATA